MSKANSYSQILQTTSIIGGASVVNVLVGLVRIKAVAVLLGPARVRLVGLLQSLMTSVSTIAALGFGTVGTRQISEAAGRGDEPVVANARRTLFWGMLLLTMLYAYVFWLLQDVLAKTVLDDAAMSANVVWLASGVALSVASGSKGALLNGLRRVGDKRERQRQLCAAGDNTRHRRGALWGKRGILAFVLAGPAASFVIGHVFDARLPRVNVPRTLLPQLATQWRPLAWMPSSWLPGSPIPYATLKTSTPKPSNSPK